MNNSGITNFNVLNTNFLYIQGIAVDFVGSSAYLQGEIDAINAALIPIESVTSRIDFNTAPSLVGNLVITETNKNSVLLTAIQNINTQIGSLNKLDLTALPAIPTGACVITPTTTNQALKSLIDANTSNISTINGQITTINNSITAINNKLAHFSTFSYGSDTMSGIADGTGFACAVTGGSVSGNGIFCFPNASSQNEQIMLVTANDKNLLLRGGNQVGIFGGTDSTLVNRNLIDIGDKLDRINIGRNHNIGQYPEVNLGVDSGTGGSASTTNVQGDIYFSAFGGVLAVAPQTPLLYGTSDPTKFGNTNNYTLKPVLTGLDVTGVGIAPITLTAVTGLIPITSLVGGITLTTGAGALTMAAGGGGCAITTGAGALSASTGAGVMSFASGSGNIETSTISGNISLGAGKALGGVTGNVSLNAKNNVVIQPDIETDIYKTAFIEFNENASAPPIIANRLYQQANQLYFDGTALGSGGSGAYVLKAGDTMTGTLVTPQVTTPIHASTSGSSSTASINIQPLATSFVNVEASTANGVPTFQVKNNLTTSNFGAIVTLNNNKTGAGLASDQLGVIKFQGKDSVSNPAQQYANISGFINDPTSVSKDGRLSTNIAVSNTMTEMMRVYSTTSGIKRCDIGSQYMAIGSAAIGSTDTSTLTCNGTANITTSLTTPLITNALNIYPATSTTLVDNAVRKYQPERLYRMIDYPTPLSAPTIDGEKVIILNNTGTPAGGIDQILQPSDFPTINGVSMTQILKSVFVGITASTPACSYIAAEYNDNTCSIFVLPDVGGVALTLIHLGRFVIASSVAFVNDFIVRLYGSTHRIYAGGKFAEYQRPVAFGGGSSLANNFSGQIVVTWSGTSPNYTIGSLVINSMLSNYCALDPITSWTGDNGVNDEISCVIDVTGQSGFAQPIAGLDSIVVGGNFTNTSSTPTSNRALLRLAYYDYTDGAGTPTMLYIQPSQTLNTSWGSNQYVTMGSFTPLVGGNYNNLYAVCGFDYTQFSPIDPPSAVIQIELLDNTLQVISQTSTFGVIGPQSYNEALTPQVTLVAGQNYTIRANCVNFSSLNSGILGYDSDNSQVPYMIFNTNLVVGYIGWRTLNSDFTIPVGPTSNIRGGGLFSSGYLGFIFDGDTITTSTISLTSNRIFSVYYSSQTAAFLEMGSDSSAIENTQTWGLGHGNHITGGNPVLAFGAGNAIAYGELYCNAGHNTFMASGGVYYRLTSIDPYEMADCLIFIDNGLSITQLKPNPTSIATASVYRDDTKYPNVFFVARSFALQTATLPFIGGVPDYIDVLFSGGGQIPCMNFGGYSSEIGYIGLVLVCPTAVYIYKGADAGELVIELVGCVVRCANNIYAQNKLTFPANQDGTSITLVGDTGIINPYSKPSWWAISQDGGIYYDNVLVNNNAGAVVTSAVAGAGIAVSSATGAVTISNTGVRQIVAGTNISISSGTGVVTINATPSAGGVTSLSPYTLPSGNATPLSIYPSYLSTGVLQAYVSPTKYSFYQRYTSGLTISNGLSIFSSNQSIPNAPLGSNINPNYLNTSKKYKLTLSISIDDNAGGGNFNSGSHWGNFSIFFQNTAIPSTSTGLVWGLTGSNLGFPITQQSSSTNTFGVSFNDIFIDDVGYSSIHIGLAIEFWIAYTGNYSASNLGGNVFWEMEYMPDA